MKINFQGKINGKVKVTAIVAVIALIAIIAVPRIMGGRETAYAEVQPPVVAVANPSTGSISRGSTLIGTVEPSKVEYVFPDISGEITSVKVKAGQKISAGQVICTIENKQLDSASISVQTAQVNLSDAKTAMERAQVLYEGGSISEESYENYKTTLSKAQLSYESAAIEYSNQSGYSSITAKTGGLVEVCDVEIYDNVSPQTQLCVISGSGEKVVTFDATEKIAKNAKVGDKITVEKSGIKYEGSVSEISTMVDQESGLFKIKATLGADADMATGSSVKVYVTSDKVENVMIIPGASVYYEDGEAVVYVYEEGIAHKVFIEIGISDEKNVEVKSGLKKTDKVITTWSAELYEGAKITVAE